MTCAARPKKHDSPGVATSASRGEPTAGTESVPPTGCRPAAGSTELDERAGRGSRIHLPYRTHSRKGLEMPTKMFVNLPVKDLDRSQQFFASLGFTTGKRRVCQ